MYINLLRTILLEWKRVLDSRFSAALPDVVLLPNDFAFMARLDNINFLKLRRFINDSNLVQKIGGYAAWIKKEHDTVNRIVSECNSCASIQPLPTCMSSLRRVSIASCFIQYCIYILSYRWLICYGA